MSARPCMVAGCDKPHRTGGLCDMHRKRLERTGTLSGVGRTGRPKKKKGGDAA